jgi:biopolymer transport protein ExbB
MDLNNPIQVILQHGGIAAYFILFSGFVLFVIGAERLYTLYVSLQFNTQKALETIESLVSEKKYTEALQICNNEQRAPTLNVIKSGLMAVENGREAMRSSISTSVLDISQRCEKRIAYLSLIANVATLLGLFGTILGLIKTFASIATADPAKKGELLGIGISEAMYATAAGLCVGILAMVVHTLCISKSDDIVGGAQNAGLRLITWVEQSERSPAHVNKRAV